MKKFNRLFLMLMLFSAVTFAFTSCSNKVEEDEGDTSEAVDGEEEDTSDEEEDTSDSDSTTAAADGDGSTFAWSDVLNDWLANGTGPTSITLEGIGDEESGLSESGAAQLGKIATILETNEDVNALIKGHTRTSQKMGNGKLRAAWAKAQLIIGHDAVGSRISTEGVGSAEPIEGVDPDDESQKRITVTFSK